MAEIIFCEGNGYDFNPVKRLDGGYGPWWQVTIRPSWQMTIRPSKENSRFQTGGLLTFGSFNHVVALRDALNDLIRLNVPAPSDTTPGIVPEDEEKL